MWDTIVWATEPLDGSPAVQIRVGTRQEAVGMSRHFHLARPTLVGELFEVLSPQIDGRPVTATATQMISDHVYEFVNFLQDDGRTLPIIVVSTGNDGPLGDADKLAEQVAGISHVRVLASDPVSFTMTEVLGRPWSVFGGAIRVYWPELDLDGDDPYRHHLILPHRIDDSTVWWLFRLIARAAVEHLEPPSLLRELRRASLREQLEAARADAGVPDEWLVTYEQTLTELDQAELAVESRNREIDRLSSELEGLRSLVQRQQTQFAQVLAATTQDQADEPATSTGPPSSVVDAVRRAAAQCQHLESCPRQSLRLLNRSTATPCGSWRTSLHSIDMRADGRKKADRCTSD